MMWWIALAVAAPSTEFEVLVGGRTAPEATIEQPSEWEAEDESAALVAGTARIDWRSKSAWGGVGAAAWGLLPETEASMISVTPGGGLQHRGEVGSARAGATYDLRWFPGEPDVSSGRLELLADTGLHWKQTEGLVGITGIDRRYAGHPEWNFSTLEPSLSAETTWRAVRLGASTSYQWNAGRTQDASGALSPAAGSQIRGRLELGLYQPLWALEAAWRPILAFEGQSENAARPQFTPVGAYADDADALSAGGFTQNRVDSSLAVTPGAWTFRASALGRWRVSDEASASFGRTLHGDLRVERDLGEHLGVFGRVGTSSVKLVSGPQYLDTMGWIGVRWRSAP